MQIGLECDAGQTNFTSTATQLDFKGEGTEKWCVGGGEGMGGGGGGEEAGGGDRGRGERGDEGTAQD